MGRGVRLRHLGGHEEVVGLAARLAHPKVGCEVAAHKKELGRLAQVFSSTPSCMDRQVKHRTNSQFARTAWATRSPVVTMWKGGNGSSGSCRRQLLGPDV